MCPVSGGPLVTRRMLRRDGELDAEQERPRGNGVAPSAELPCASCNTPLMSLRSRPGLGRRIPRDSWRSASIPSPAASAVMIWCASTWATRKIRRWACRWRRPTSPTGSSFSSTTARQARMDLTGGQDAGMELWARRRRLLPGTHLAPGLLHRAGLKPRRHRLLPRKRHHVPGLDFVCGNAENLPFADQLLDAVINIEDLGLVHQVSPLPRRGGPGAAPGRPYPCTPTSAHTTKSPSGRKNWATPPCASCRKGSSVMRLRAGWETNTPRMKESNVRYLPGSMADKTLFKDVPPNLRRRQQPLTGCTASSTTKAHRRQKFGAGIAG